MTAALGVLAWAVPLCVLVGLCWGWHRRAFRSSTARVLGVVSIVAVALRSGAAATLPSSGWRAFLDVVAIVAIVAVAVVPPNEGAIEK
jgi:hypothetical protein